MTPAQTRYYLKETIKALGGPNKIADKLQISRGHVQAVFDRCIHPGQKLRAHLGLRRDAQGEYHKL